jgi:hypothetical protein
VRQTSEDLTDIVNVFHFLAAPWSGAYTTGDLLDAIAGYFDVAYANLNNYIPTNQVPNDIKVDIVELVGGEEVVTENIGTTSWGSTYDPASAGESYAPGVAALVILRTLVGKVFGRKFVGQLSEAALSNGILSTLLQASLAAFGAALLDKVELSATERELFPGVLSKRTSGFQTFSAVDVNPEPAYQRRRKRSVGS